jgi:hypothetical protein
MFEIGQSVKIKASGRDFLPQEFGVIVAVVEKFGQTRFGIQVREEDWDKHNKYDEGVREVVASDIVAV